MEKVLIVGSTGYLGSHAVKAFKEKGYYVRALARDKVKLDPVKSYIDDIFEGHVTQPETLKGVCDGIDYVFSSLGITRQPGNETYMDVDYGGNKNILDLCIQASVKKFIFTSVFNPHDKNDILIFQAKEKFVEELKNSGIDYAVMRPTAFFSDMGELFKMGQKGKITLIGDGQTKSNPIDGYDLAGICVDAINSKEKDIPVGGPEIYTQQEAAELIFSILGTPPKISRIPLFIVRAVAAVVLPFLGTRKRGGLEFLLTVFMNDFVAPCYEGKSMKDYFIELKA